MRIMLDIKKLWKMIFWD